jgi:hypothetical protein
LRDLAVKRELLDLGEGQMAKEVMSLHEFGLGVNGGEVDMLVLLEFGIYVKGECPHPCGLRLLFTLLFSQEVACWHCHIVAHGSLRGQRVLFLMSACTFSSAMNSLSR